MPLSSSAPIGFIPISDADAARTFYENTLGLTFVSDDNFALVFRLAGDIMLRLVRMPNVTPAPFTIFGWEVSNMEDAVDELTANGVSFVRFDVFQQDERGIWTAPGGARVAWFRDPDGNTLSLSQHA